MTATVVPLLLWLALGLGAGVAYWRSLRWGVDRLACGRSVALPAALQLLRFAAIGAALVLIATQWGGSALLLFTAGLTLTRVLAVRGPVWRGVVGRNGGRA